MSLKEDWAKLPKMGKVAIIGGGGLAVFFLGKTALGAITGSSAATTTAATVTTPTDSSSGNSTDSTGSMDMSTADAINQLAANQQMLAQVLASSEQQLSGQIDASNQTTTAAITSLFSQMQGLTATGTSTPQSPVLSMPSTPTSNVSTNAPAGVDPSTAPGTATMVSSVPAPMISMRNPTITTSIATSSAPSTQPVNQTPTVQLVKTSNYGPPTSSAPATAQQTQEMTTAGTLGLAIGAAAAGLPILTSSLLTSPMPTAPAGTLGNVGAGDSGVPAGYHKVAVPVNLKPGEHHAPTYKLVANG